MFFKKVISFYRRKLAFAYYQVRYKSYYVTTPIFYVNASPHIGHLFTVTLADVVCRWHNLESGGNEAARLVSGCDEHGLKVMQAAKCNSLSEQEYCNKVSQRFKNLYDKFQINCYDFIRTSEKRHEAAVKQFWNVLFDRGYIYKGEYEGWYCTSDETFVSESDVEKVNDDAGQTVHMSADKVVEWTKEVNYMFQLSNFTDTIYDWINSNPSPVQPEAAKHMALRMLRQSLSDLSVSRDRKRVPWGIKVPNDPSQTIYVWMDALINYLTAAGYPNINSNTFLSMWPADTHLIGIDILKFHAIYWPAFLMAADLPLPKQILVHFHWTVNNVKMSKSKGNVIDPFDTAERVTAAGLRYFLLRQAVLDSNCNYHEELLFRSINGDLANDLGNCLYRATAKHLNPSQLYPPFHRKVFDISLKDTEFHASTDERNFVDQVRQLPEDTKRLANNFQFSNIVRSIGNVVRLSNLIIQRNRVWTLDQSVTEQKVYLDTMLHCVYEGLRVSGILLQPIVPDIADDLLTKLGVPRERRTWRDGERSFQEFDGLVENLVGTRLGTGGILFKRLKYP